MAKKAELLEEAKNLGLEMTEKNTIAEIEAAIKSAGASNAETEVATEEKHTAKAGKRSEKSLREAEEKAEKEARKEAGDTTPQSEEAEVPADPASCIQEWPSALHPGGGVPFRPPMHRATGRNCLPARLSATGRRPPGQAKHH